MCVQVINCEFAGKAGGRGLGYCLNIFSEVRGWQTSHPGSPGQREGAAMMGASVLMFPRLGARVLRNQTLSGGFRETAVLI